MQGNANVEIRSHHTGRHIHLNREGPKASPQVPKRLKVERVVYDTEAFIGRNLRNGFDEGPSARKARLGRAPATRSLPQVDVLGGLHLTRALACHTVGTVGPVNSQGV